MKDRFFDLIVSCVAAVVYCFAIPTMMLLCGLVWCCTPVVLGYQWSMKVLKRNWQHNADTNAK